jgi:hypothetical protein
MCAQRGHYSTQTQLNAEWTTSKQQHNSGYNLIPSGVPSQIHRLKKLTLQRGRDHRLNTIHSWGRKSRILHEFLSLAEITFIHQLC